MKQKATSNKPKLNKWKWCGTDLLFTKNMHITNSFVRKKKYIYTNCADVPKTFLIFVRVMCTYYEFLKDSKREEIMSSVRKFNAIIDHPCHPNNS